MVYLMVNPVHSVLFLVLTFCFGSVIFIMLGAEFYGLTYLIVYVGAIAVLFLFVVMMLDLKGSSETNEILETTSLTQMVDKISSYFTVCFTLLSAIYINFVYGFFDSSAFNGIKSWLSYILRSVNYDSLISYIQIIDLNDQIQCIGISLFSTYLICVLIIGIVLLIGLMGPIVLALIPDNRVSYPTSRLLSRNNKGLVFYSN